MFKDTKAYSGFAVDDLDRAQQFYGETLGIEVERWNEMLLALKLAGGRDTLIYAKPDFQPATYTILNFPVDDIDATVDELVGRGVEMERYEGFNQDDKGIARGIASGEGPDIVWFRDPAGNILSALKEA